MKTRIKKVAFSFDDNFFWSDNFLFKSPFSVTHKQNNFIHKKKELKKIIGEVQARTQLLLIPTRNSCIFQPTHMSIRKYTKFIKKKFNIFDVSYIYFIN